MKHCTISLLVLGLLLCHTGMAMEHKTNTRTECVAVKISMLAEKIIAKVNEPQHINKQLLDTLHLFVQAEYKNVEYDTKFFAMKFYREHIAQAAFTKNCPKQIEFYEDRFVFVYPDGMQEHYCLMSNGGWRLLLWNGKHRPYCVATNKLGS